MKDKNEPLTPAGEKQAMDSAKAAGRSAPNSHDVRDAIKANEADKDQPKQAHSPNRTGNAQHVKNEMSDAPGRRSPDASRHSQ